MGSKSVDQVLDAAAAGIHYSTLRREELSLREQPTTSGLENGHQEPFVIGQYASEPAARALRRPAGRISVIRASQSPHQIWKMLFRLQVLPEVRLLVKAPSAK
jgi:hypothetical protein